MTAQWRQLTGGGEALRAHVGANTYDRAAVRRWMDASQVGPAAGEATTRDADVVLGYLDGWAAQGFRRWADLDLAEAWFRRAAELTTTTREAAVDAMAYPAQLAAVTEALQALANGYRALDLPWCIDPVFRGLVEGSLLGVARNPCERGAWSEVFYPHAYVSTDGGRCVAIWERWHCGPYATVDASHVTANEAHADGTPSTSPWVHHYDQKHGRLVWWKSWAMYGECLRRMGAGGCEDWQSWCLPPPFWWWKWVREASRDALVRGMVRVVVDGLVLAQLLNSREALRLGVLQRVTAEQPSFAAATAVIAGLAAVDLERARDMTNSDAYRRAREAFGVVGAIAGAATGGAGATLVSILWGVAELAARLLPAAVMRAQDVWRRDLPAFERTTITARTGAEEPSHEVPDPPGWERPARASTGASLASPLRGSLFAPGAGSGVSVLAAGSPGAPESGKAPQTAGGGKVRPAAQTEGGGVVLWELPGDAEHAGGGADAPSFLEDAFGPPGPGPGQPPVVIPPASEVAPRRWPWALGAGVALLGAVALVKGAARRTDQ